MQRSTAIFLILLRLAIGWHFLVEGLQKVRSVDVGETVTNRPFSSAGYFREAPGPLGPYLREYIGDPDEQALARLTIRSLGQGADPANERLRERMPPGLKADWDDYLQRFIEHYDLDAEQQKLARAKVDQAETRLVQWLLYQPAPILDEVRSRFGKLDGIDANELGPKERDAYAAYVLNTSEQKRTYPAGEVTRRMTMAERIEEYRAKRAALKEATTNKLWLFNKDVEGAKLRQARAETAQLRAGLMKDIDEQSQAMAKSLEDVLTKAQKAMEPMPPAPGNEVLAWVDWATRWGLTAIGACLLIGLFTRFNCLLAAGFLLTTYLLVPPLPWVPVVGPSEGNYLFVNKNLIEMLALCVLATTRTGRWFGVDGILYGFASLLFGVKNEPPK